MSSSMPYLGCKISLISKAEIRYEGILYMIDAVESTVALAKVQSFGTEDRQTERQIPPRNDVFDYIIFRGTDIKDLYVCEPPQAIIEDPAIIKSSQPMNAGNSSDTSLIHGQAKSSITDSGDVQNLMNPLSNLSLHPPSAHQPYSLSAREQQYSSLDNNHANQRNKFDRPAQHGPRSTGRAPPPGIHHAAGNHHNERSVGSQGQASRGSRGAGGQNRPIQFAADFDFESSNAKFDKEQIEKEMKQHLTISDDAIEPTDADDLETPDMVCPVYYDKAKSFFDNISSNTASNNAKGSRGGQSGGRHNQRKMNSETFGVTADYRGKRGGYRGNREWGGRGYNDGSDHGGYSSYRQNNYRDRSGFKNRENAANPQRNLPEMMTVK